MFGCEEPRGGGGGVQPVDLAFAICFWQVAQVVPVAVAVGFGGNVTWGWCETVGGPDLGWDSGGQRVVGARGSRWGRGCVGQGRATEDPGQIRTGIPPPDVPRPLAL